MNTLNTLQTNSNFSHSLVRVSPSYLPDEGAEAGGAQPHVALDPQEAQEEGGDAFHQPQVVELLGVLGEHLLQTQRRQEAALLAPPLRRRRVHQYLLLPFGHAPGVGPVAG